MGSKSMLRDIARGAVLGQVQRDNLLLAFPCSVTKDIQGNSVEPLAKVQGTNLVCRRAFERIIGTQERFPNDVFSIVWTSCQAQGKEIESLLVDLDELPKMTVQVGSQQREEFHISLIHRFSPCCFAFH